jgi:hypothetical protein
MERGSRRRYVIRELSKCVAAAAAGGFVFEKRQVKK